MFNILIVDDEPMICKGLNNLLQSSGLDIHEIFIAHSGQQAFDYIRLEEIDLIVTDIQMDQMNGIELMQQAKLIKPWSQFIIISAYDNFQYAQLAIRLGAKDYLIKPLNSEQFLDSVRNVLLKTNKEISEQKILQPKFQEDFRMEELSTEKVKFLNRLLTDPDSFHSDLNHSYGIQLSGPYFAILKVVLEKAHEDSRIEKGSEKFYQYSILNIINEILLEQKNDIAFYALDGGINVIVQWDEESYYDSTVNKITQLELLSRTIHHNVKNYLNLNCIIGFSQILKGRNFLHVLSDQAIKALKWNREYRDHYIFYYGDFNWSEYSGESNAEDLLEQNTSIIEQVKEYIDQNYMKKGLTMQEIAQQNHVSPNYLSYLFKKDTGYNLWEYVIMKRMEKSKWLLLHSGLRRYEIAEKIGYESPEHFSKIFKKYFGISPSEIKK